MVSLRSVILMRCASWNCSVIWKRSDLLARSCRSSRRSPDRSTPESHSLPYPTELPFVSRKKIRHRNSGKSGHDREKENFRRVSDDKKGRIALIKNKAGKKFVPRHEQHQQETDCGTNRHPQRHPAVSTVPTIGAADHQRRQKQHRKTYSGYTTEFQATNSG